MWIQRHLELERDYPKVNLTTNTTVRKHHKNNYWDETFVQDFINRPDFERLQLGIWIWKEKNIYIIRHM